MGRFAASPVWHSCRSPFDILGLVCSAVSPDADIVALGASGSTYGRRSTRIKSMGAWSRLHDRASFAVMTGTLAPPLMQVAGDDALSRRGAASAMPKPAVAPGSILSIQEVSLEFFISRKIFIGRR